jgi:serine/threonine-protein kinase
LQGAVQQAMSSRLQGGSNGYRNGYRNTFRIVECMGEGGMGRLYRAEHLRLHRPVAVKFMVRSLVANPEASARFKREAEIISQLDHPHVVHVLDFDTTERGDAYIVMELLKGMPSSQRLLERRSKCSCSHASLKR